MLIKNVMTGMGLVLLILTFVMGLSVRLIYADTVVFPAATPASPDDGSNPVSYHMNEDGTVTTIVDGEEFDGRPACDNCLIILVAQSGDKPTDDSKAPGNKGKLSHTGDQGNKGDGKMPQEDQDRTEGGEAIHAVSKK